MRQQHAPRSVHIRDVLSDLKFCTRKRDLQKGRRIHTDAVETGINLNIYVATALINMYAKCGSIAEARTVFQSIQEPDVVSWNALILGHADNGQGLVAQDLFSRMKNECSCSLDSVTYIAVLKACTSLAAAGGESGKNGCLSRGRAIHSEMIGCHLTQSVQSTLIHMYAKCSSMADAQTVFDDIQNPDVVSWNALLLGYADNGQGLVALDLFSRMKHEAKSSVDSVTYLAVLKACTSLALGADGTARNECLERGKEMHLEIGPHMDQFVQSALIDMYAKCRSMVDARKVFDAIQEPDVVSWNALIMGYVDNGLSIPAVDLFSRMKAKRRCAPNSVTYTAVLKACTSLAASGDESTKAECLKRGKEIHSQIGSHMDHFVQCTLIDMHAKCGSMVDARSVFDSIQELDVASWTVLILGYTDNGQGLAALDMFSRMKDECKCAPDAMTYVAALKACRSIGALAIGRSFHSEIKVFDAHVVACLVDFYANCGSMEEAQEVFDLHRNARNVPIWNALLTGYSSFGDTGSVLNLFEAMQEQDFQPNAITFLCLLVCCSHAGLVEKAWEYLGAMRTLYGVTPTVRHYNCMVDLLGRSNKVNEAVLVLHEMPCNGDAVTWMTLLGACRKWRNSAIGRLAFESLMHLDQQNASAYVLLAEIYGSKGMWEEQERVLETRMKCPASKLWGQTYVMDGLGKMVSFTVGQEDPPDVKACLATLLSVGPGVGHPVGLC